MSSLSPCVVVPLADLVLRAVRPMVVAPFLTGFPRKPAVVVGVEVLVDVVLVDVPLAEARAGTMFSFSGSSNLTVFLTAGFAKDLVVVVVVVDTAGRPRVVFLTGSAALVVSSEVVLLARTVLVALTDSSATGSATFLGRPRVRTVGAGSGSDTSTFLGRPRPRVAWGAAVDILSMASSSSSSSNGLFLFTAVLVVVAAVAVEVDVDVDADVVVAVRVVLALAAAVTIRVGLVVDSELFAAARARVILLGGDGSILVDFVFACLGELRGRNLDEVS